jgi:hypothetical protein
VEGKEYDIECRDEALNELCISFVVFNCLSYELELGCVVEFWNGKFGGLDLERVILLLDDREALSYYD